MNRKGFATVILVAAVMAAYLVHQRTANVQLRAERDRLFDRAASLRTLRGPVALVIPAAFAGDSAADVGKEERHLKQTIELLSGELESRKKASAPDSAGNPRKGPVRPFAVLPGMTAPEDMRDVGRGTPAAAWQTQIAAIIKGDFATQSQCIAFSPEEKAAADTYFASLSPEEQAFYGNSTQMVEMGIGFTYRNGILTLPPAAFTAETYTGPNDAEVSMQLQTDAQQLKSGPQAHFVRGASGWQMLIPSEEVALTLNTLKNMPPQQRPGAVPP